MARTDAKRVILEIIRQADGEFAGKTKLFKAFYFAHLVYFDKNPGILTDWPVARMLEGPGIHNSRQLFDELKKDAAYRWSSCSTVSTDDLGMTGEQFDAAGRQVARALLADYSQLRVDVRKFLIQMPKL